MLTENIRKALIADKSLSTRSFPSPYVNVPDCIRLIRKGERGSTE